MKSIFNQKWNDITNFSICSFFGKTTLIVLERMIKFIFLGKYASIDNQV